MKQFAILLMIASVLIVSVSSMAVQKPKNIEQAEFLEELKPRIIDFLTDFWNLIIAEPVNTLTSSLASMVAQLTAGLAINGIGKRDLNQLADFVQNIKEQLLAVFKKFIEKLSAGFFQLTSQIPSTRGWSDFWQPIQESLFQLGNTAVQQIGLAITQALLNFSQGKREIQNELSLKGWAEFWQPIQDSLFELGNTAVQQIGLALTQALLNFSQGKRDVEDVKGIFDDLVASLSNLGNTLVQQAALAITQALLDFSQGKRDLEQARGPFDDILASLANLGNTLVQQAALAITQALLDFSQGKRDLEITDKSWFNNLDNLVQAIALQITQILVNIQNNGILPIIGK